MLSLLSLSKLFTNLAIKRKLQTAFGILILFLLAFAWFAIYQVTQIRNQHIPARASVREMNRAIEAMRKNQSNFMLFDLKDTADQSFYATQDSLHLRNFNQEYLIFQSHLEDLEGYLADRQQYQYLEQLHQAEELVADMHLSFLELTGKYHQRGFVQHGFEGQMREAAHELETQLAQNPRTAVDLLEARRHEKDFFLRKDLTYVEDFNQALEQLRLDVQHNPEQLALVDEYGLRFQQIVQLETEIGLNDNSGLLGQQKATSTQAEELIETTTVQIITLTTQTLNLIQVSLVVLSLLLGALSFYFAKIIGQIIANPVSQLETAAKTLARGDLSRRVQIESKDEIGQLADAFNTMSATIQKSTQEIKKTSEQNSAILRGIGDGVFALDKEGKVILFNPVASEISGYTLAEVKGQHYSKYLQFLDESTQQPKDDFIRKALEGEHSSMANHTVIVTKDQQQIPVADSAAPILDDNGQVQGIVVVFRDATQERQLEKLKDEFVSVASHELRTPMTAIKGLVSMIREGEYGQVPASLEEPLKGIFTSTERLIHLVNDLLSVSRIEAGRQKLTLEKVELEKMVSQVLNSLQPLAKEKGLALSGVGLQPYQVLADDNKLQQILNNLLGNALKFTDQGQIEVRLEERGDFVEIAITDTGIGIDPSDQEKLFSKFSQIASQDVGRPAGTGLGLYISRELAQKMGGELWLAESVAGQGSTFKLKLPKWGSKPALAAQKRVSQEAAAHSDQKA